MSIRQWLISLALKKGMARGVTALVGVLGARIASPALGATLAKLCSTVGLCISITFQSKIAEEFLFGYLVFLITGGLETFRNWIKVKKGFAWIP